jgi:membrane dipeptidase
MPLAPDAQSPSEAAARAVMASGVVWDNHACLPLKPGQETWLAAVDRHRTSGVDVVSLNVGYGEDGPDKHLAVIEHYRAWYGARPGRYVLAKTAKDIRAAKAQGKLAIVFDIEGMNALGGDPGRVQTYYDLGVRWMLIAYNRSNPAGGGCLDDDQGLTEFGRAAIEEMEKAGMLLCCSHTGWRTAREAIAVSRAPVILSHSNAFALWENPRNVPDELMIACARTGGVVGINGVGPFMGDGAATAFGVVKHIEHALALVGEDHVSIGLDYSFDRQGTAAYVRRMEPHLRERLRLNEDVHILEPEAFPEILGLMLARGHAAPVVRKVMGGNLMRLAEQVWR